MYICNMQMKVGNESKQIYFYCHRVRLKKQKITGSNHRQGVCKVLGFNTLQYCCQNRICIVIMCI
jgi:hypothetical protein